MVQRTRFIGAEIAPKLALAESPSFRRNRRRDAHRINTLTVVAYASCCLLFPFATAFSPSAGSSLPRISIISVQHKSSSSISTTQLYNLFPKDDLFPKDEFDKDPFLDEEEEEVKEGYDPVMMAQIKKAKALLADAKKKQKAEADAKAAALQATLERDESNGLTVTEEEDVNAPAKLPFFATKSFTTSAADSARKIKSKTSTGEIIADGETMASLSASEAWERRSLSQMFNREAREDYDGNVVEPEVDDAKVLADRDVAMSIWNLRKKLQDNDFKKVFDSRNRFIGDLD